MPGGGQFTQADRKVLQETHDAAIRFYEWKEGHEIAEKNYKTEHGKTHVVVDKRLDDHSKGIDTVTNWQYRVIGGVAVLVFALVLAVKMGWLK